VFLYNVSTKHLRMLVFEAIETQ